MKVFCRFAPPGSSAASPDGRPSDAALLLRAEGQPLKPSPNNRDFSSAAPGSTGTRVYLADPNTLSKAAFSCDGVILPLNEAPQSGNGWGNKGKAFQREEHMHKEHQQQQQQQQELLYAATCSGLVGGNGAIPTTAVGFTSAPRRIYLAYGQTASGKTYSLFGSPSAGPQAAVKSADGLSPTAGVVPRFLYDVFHNAPQGCSGSAEKLNLTHTTRSSAREDAGRVFVDVSCFEVYNEVTTDLIALSTTVATSAAVAGTAGSGCRGASNRAGARGSRGVTTASAAYNSSSNGSAPQRQQLDLLQQEQAVVWAAHSLYRDAQDGEDDASSVKNSVSSCHSPRFANVDYSGFGGGGGVNGVASVSSQASQDEYSSGRPADLLNSTTHNKGGGYASPFMKTEYKSTEKQQVLRCVERARCTSFASAQAVLHALLALRQECATSRNQSSSRGHLIFRVEVYRRAEEETGEDDGDAFTENRESGEGEVGQWWLQHETAFVDLAGSESGRLTEANSDGLDGASTEPFASLSAPNAATSRKGGGGGGGAGVMRGFGQRLRGRSSGPPSVNGSFAAASASSRASSQHSRTSHDTSSVHSAASSSASAASRCSSGGLATYHRYLLHPPQAEDVRALRTRRQRETRCINASLLALRKVFRALYEATQQQQQQQQQQLMSNGNCNSARSAGLRRPPLHHAPFKDSALTAILEPFLLPQPAPLTSTALSSVFPPSNARSQGERSNTADSVFLSAAHVVLLVCCSSRSVDFFETVASLRLGAEATAVNPEVVLRSLPVQQWEKQQQQQQQIQIQQQLRADSGGRFSRTASGGPQKLFRSASAPNQRLLLLAPAPPAATPRVAGDEGRSRLEAHCTEASRSSNTTTAPCGKGKNGDGSSSPPLGTGSAEEVAQLQEEVQRYKSTAQQLYKQCKSLCESYDECVEELGRCRAALTEKDALIAELKRQVGAAEKPRTSTPASMVHLEPPPPMTQIVKESNDSTESHGEKQGSLASILTRGEANATTSNGMDGTPVRDGPGQCAEGSSSPAARSPGSASPSQRMRRHPQDQQQQQRTYYEMCRISRDVSTSGRATAGGARDAWRAQDSTDQQQQQMQPQQQQQQLQPCKLETRGGGARVSRSRGLSSSTAREDSARCLVSVSPFSTASMDVAGNARRSVVPEEVEEEEERVDPSEAASQHQAFTAPAKMHEPLRNVVDLSSAPVGEVGNEKCQSAFHDERKEQQQQQQSQQPNQQQLQKARSIMNTLLARQIFPPVTILNTAASPSPARENSPSPLLPALSAHNTAVTPLPATPPFAKTAGANHPVKKEASAWTAAEREAVYPAGCRAGSPLTPLSVNAPPSLRTCPSCGVAGGKASPRQTSTSSNSTDHSGSGSRSGIVQRSSYDGGATTSSDTARRSPSDEERREVDNATLRPRQPPFRPKISPDPHDEALTKTRTATVAKDKLAGCEVDSSAAASHQASTKVECTSPFAKSCGCEVESHKDEDEDRDAVEEVVISYRGSPSAHENEATPATGTAATAATTSEGSTRRSKSTVFTALMPPSPSRSPPSSRSPSFHESLPNTYDVYQL